MQRLIEQESDDAFLMAVSELGITDPDILSERVACTICALPTR